MSGDKEKDRDELVIIPRAALEFCWIYTQCMSEGKGALAAATKAFQVGLVTQVADA